MADLIINRLSYAKKKFISVFTTNKQNKILTKMKKNRIGTSRDHTLCNE
mgnify:CR=1 FL=1